MARPRHYSHQAARLGLALVLTMGGLVISSCGSAGKVSLSGDAVVRAGSSSIAMPELDHWMLLEAKADWGYIGEAHSVPFVPDAPRYTACIARLGKASSQLAKRKGISPDAQAKSTCVDIYERVKDGALEELIPMQWQLAEAVHLGLGVSASELERRYQKIKKQEFPTEAKFAAFLSKTGYTVADLMMRTKVGILKEIIQQRLASAAKKRVNAAFVAKYYEEHKSRYAEPERRDIQIVKTKSQAQAQVAKRKVKATSDFEGLAGSEGVEGVKSTAQNGQAETTAPSTTTELSELSSGTEPEPLNHAIFTAPVNVAIGPVKTSSDYYIFEVERINPPTSPLPLEQVQPELTQQLITTAQKKATGEFEKKWIARTECRAGYLVKGCKGYELPKKP